MGGYIKSFEVVDERCASERDTDTGATHHHISVDIVLLGAISPVKETKSQTRANQNERRANRDYGERKWHPLLHLSKTIGDG